MKKNSFALSLSKCVVLLALLVLPGCKTIHTAPPPVSRHPQAADMQPCAPLEKPADGSLASLYRYGIAAAHRYHECRDRHDNLVEWVSRGLEDEKPRR